MVQDVFLMMVVSRGKNKHVRGSKLENVYIEFQIEKHFWIRIYCSLCLKSLGLGDWLCTQGLQLLDDHATSCMCSICTNMYQLEKKAKFSQTYCTCSLFGWRQTCLMFFQLWKHDHRGPSAPKPWKCHGCIAQATELDGWMECPAHGSVANSNFWLQSQQVFGADHMLYLMPFMKYPTI